MTQNAGTFEQAFNLLCHEKIGEGSSRQVFSSLLLPDCVIKIESTPGSFQNVMEWETFKASVGTPASRWLAQCRWISPNGEILIQERTRPAAHTEFPRLIPAWLTDLKPENFGMASTTNAKTGKPGPDYFVCHDYGVSLAIDHGFMVSKKPANWPQTKGW